MKKSIMFVLALVLVFALTVSAMATAPAKVDGNGATVTASVDKLKGNQNKLSITISPIVGDPITQSFTIDNNAAGTYTLGDYKVYVDTKGNTKINACYFVTVPRSHNYHEVVTATCWTGGWTKMVCSNCGDEYNIGWQGALGHDYYVIETTEPGCTHGGGTHVRCTRCGYDTWINWQGALGHVYVVKETIVADSSHGGGDHVVCSRCGDDTWINWIAAHDYHKVVTATCWIGGETKMVCSNCGDEYSIGWQGALGHDFIVDHHLDPTASSGGGDYVICTRLGCGYGTWVNWVGPLGST